MSAIETAQSDDRGGFWNFGAIAEEQRQRIEYATHNWSADQLREKLIEVVAACYPVNYVLSHIVDNPARPHGGMSIMSDLFPHHFPDHRPPDGWEGAWGVAHDSGQWTSVPIQWDAPQPDSYYERHECDMDGGVTPHPSFRVLSIWQYATAASINCGSFGSEEIRRMDAALSRCATAPTNNPSAEN